MPTGRRCLQEEKPFLTELGRIFHLVKAHFRERPAKQPAPRRSPSRSHHSDPTSRAGRLGSSKSSNAQRRASARRSASGGSIWITFKGGFATRHVPAPSQRRRAEAKAAARVALSLKKRRQALERAEGFVQSAWQQAAEAGLLTVSAHDNNNVTPQDVSARRTGKTTQTESAVDLSTMSATELMRRTLPNEEGASYLMEQYAIAVSMLCPAAVGSHVRALLETVSAGGHMGHERNDASHKRRNNNISKSSSNNSNSTTQYAGMISSESVSSAHANSVWAVHRSAIQEIRWREYMIRHTVYGPNAEANAQLACANDVHEDEEHDKNRPHAADGSGAHTSTTTTGCVGDDDETLTKAERYYFLLREPTASASASATASDAMTRNEEAEEKNNINESTPAATGVSVTEDILPNKCIVRVRSSQRVKQTMILSKVKDIHHFVSNFSQVMRKELSSSRLPRAPAVEEEAMRAGGAGDGHNGGMGQAGVRRDGKAANERHGQNHHSNRRRR